MSDLSYEGIKHLHAWLFEFPVWTQIVPPIANWNISTRTMADGMAKITQLSRLMIFN